MYEYTITMYCTPCITRCATAYSRIELVCHATKYHRK